MISTGAPYPRPIYPRRQAAPVRPRASPSTFVVNMIGAPVNPPLGAGAPYPRYLPGQAPGDQAIGRFVIAETPI
jgi:hypothetical protein